ncbi:MAG: hypothetical protein LUE14_01725 [Clostridiales bacterium]|nr:hypothetical protein [Clostridiales bacterium]MCD8108815.1 hypothetical protein [Clostridiales bacterium]MCD8133821.1 hypothetical protein [Clostridiales bacterium]
MEKENKTSQHEDAALKVMMQFFADELLPYLGILGKVIRAAPAETVQLELHKSFEDFNLVMEDGSWKHFEFQSTNGGMEDLKRFRVYEANLSYQYGVRVTTYVLFSGGIKNPMTSFTEGVNTYRICPIIMQGKDADREIAKLWKKIAAGEPLTKEDLVPLALTPLMGGEMKQKDRVLESLDILRRARNGFDDQDCIDKLEAVIYTMAEKFLENLDMEEVRKGVAMTRLGQMLIEEGWEKGREEGRKEGREEGREEDRGRMNTLILKLSELGRINDITRAAKDRPYQEELLQEFGL